MYPVFWVAVPIFMACYYSACIPGCKGYEGLVEALHETEGKRFLVLINEAVSQYMFHGFSLKQHWSLLAISRYHSTNPFPLETSESSALPIDYHACYIYWRNNYLNNLRRQYNYRKLQLIFAEAMSFVLPIALFVTFFFQQDGQTWLMVLSGAATLIVAVLGGFGSYRSYKRLKAEEGVLTDLDVKFTDLINADQPTTG